METIQQGAVTITKVDGIKAGWEQWILLQSDQHFDSVVCNRDLLEDHLAEAKKRKAWIIGVGDWYDAMQGRFDPRRSMAELRPEYRRDDYYDYVVADSTKFLSPYKNNLLLMGDGNHELSVLKNANTNLSDRLVNNLRAGGSSVVHGGYGGWAIVHVIVGATGPKFAVKIRYYHGSGGESPVTRGAIQTNRQAVYLPDADVVVNGHSHNDYIIPIARERITVRGYHYQDICWYLRTPGYKQGYGNGTGGWEVTRGGVPKPIGAIWLQLRYEATHNRRGQNHNGELIITPHEDIRPAEMVTPSGELYDGPVYDEDDFRQE